MGHPAWRSGNPRVKVAPGVRSLMIKFNCPSCSQKLRVPEDRAGKKGKCPKCKNAILIPDSQIVADLLTPAPAAEIQEPAEPGPYKLTFLDAPRISAPQNEPTEDNEESDPALMRTELPLLGSVRHEPEPLPQRKLPWIIDVFLFPISPLSVVVLLLCLAVPIMLRIVLFSLGPFMPMFLPFAWITLIMLYLYAFWYFSASISHSAEGQIRAPSAAIDAPGIWDMLLNVFRAIICLLCFFFPMIFYLGRTQTFDTIFWLLFAFGVFMFPMGLLAVTVLDSFAGLNPVRIVGSALKTLLPYSCIVAIYFGIGFLLTLAGPFWRQGREIFYISIAGIFYLLLVAGHLLGRFYFKYQDKLSWAA